MKHWVVVLAIFLFACSTLGTKGPSGPIMDRRVEGNSIFVGDELYAELILICKDDISDRYKGIAIHYANGDRYEWISPEEGWTITLDGRRIDDIGQLKKNWVWDRHPDYSRLTVLKGSKNIDHKDYILIDWRWDMKIAEDGLSVTYVEGRFFGPKDMKYKVK